MDQLPTLRIAILDLYNGVENEGMRCIKKIVHEFESQENFSVNCQIFDVRQLAEVPDLSFDIYISTGGPGSPKPEGHAWERKYFRFLDSLWKYNKDHHNRVKKHLFLICHSFQLACVHWQIGLVGKRRSNSFGTFPIHQTHFAENEPLFKGLEDPFWAVDSRDYQVIEPNNHVLEHLGAKIVCLEKIRPHVPLDRAVMGIRFSNEIFGTQFHPEADAEGMLRYFLKDEKKQAIIKNHGEAKYYDMIEHLNDPDKILLTEKTILPTFLKIASQRIYSASQSAVF
ncbi:type 1 glutamine amidotransferase [Arundinibacter roseus]|uniref:GMP synthase n=1 Tax=Arundinibacter roseus TaxID=2070510 RepID=A0A4R4KG51_9BACT|nr:GMP synthase [Arundinibacter roseus]TDB67024.1 GMP synthase [Arundinibacter roseus]